MLKSCDVKTSQQLKPKFGHHWSMLSRMDKFGVRAIVAEIKPRPATNTG